MKFFTSKMRSPYTSILLCVGIFACDWTTSTPSIEDIKPLPHQEILIAKTQEFANSTAASAFQARMPSLAKQELEKKSLELLPFLIDYSQDSSHGLERTILEFAQDVFYGIPVVEGAEPFRMVHNLPGTLFENGDSGNEVYFVLAGDKMVFVVKRYRAPSDEFLREVASLRLLKQLELKYSSSPTVLGVGKARLEKHPYFLLAQSVAGGESIRGMIDGVLNHDPAESRFNPQYTRKAMRSLGMALAELHSKRKRKKALNYNIFEFYVSQVMPKFSTQEQNLLKSYHHNFMRKLHSLLVSKFDYSLVHGDAHPANFFYDSESGQIWMIDVNKLYDSYDKQGSPIALPQFDVFKIESYLKFYLEHLGLSEEEYRELWYAFLGGYVSIWGDIEQTSLFEFISEFDHAVFHFLNIPHLMPPLVRCSRMQGLAHRSNNIRHSHPWP